jgi:regulator of replication initiation timing
MRFDIHVHQHADLETRRQLDHLERLLGKIMHNLKEALEEIRAGRTQVASLVAYNEALKSRLDAITEGKLPADMQEQIDNLFDEAHAIRTDAAAAMNENTPAQNVDPAQAGGGAGASGAGSSGAAGVSGGGANQSSGDTASGNMTNPAAAPAAPAGGDAAGSATGGPAAPEQNAGQQANDPRASPGSGS